jgi:hypothetical protein
MNTDLYIELLEKEVDHYKSQIQRLIKSYTGRIETLETRLRIEEEQHPKKIGKG